MATAGVLFMRPSPSSQPDLLIQASPAWGCAAAAAARSGEDGAAAWCCGRAAAGWASPLPPGLARRSFWRGACIRRRSDFQEKLEGQKSRDLGRLPGEHQAVVDMPRARSAGGQRAGDGLRSSEPRGLCRPARAGLSPCQSLICNQATQGQRRAYESRPPKATAKHAGQDVRGVTI